MPQINNSFLKSKMNKDVDDRIIPNGEYRDAQNLQISRSAGDSVGEFENILSNEKAAGTNFGFNAGAGSSVIGQFTDEEYANKVGWGHSSMELVMQIAYKANINRLALFHHDPDRTDSMLDALSAQHRPTYQGMSPPMGVIWAREGMSLPV